MTLLQDLYRWAVVLAALLVRAMPVQAQCTPSWIPAFGGQPGVDGTINAFKVFNDGNGAALYVGGNFTHAGGITALCIAKWNGSTWSSLYGMFGTVSALTVFDDGSGPALFAGGSFGVAKWDGATWTYLANGPNGNVLALASFDDGSGPALYVGGAFSTVNGAAANGVAKWNGSAWSSGSGFSLGVSGVAGARVLSLAVFDDGFGTALYVGGNFKYAGTVLVNYIAKWDGFAWSAIGSGMNEHVSSLTVYDDGNGPGLYAGGNFTNAGGATTNHLAKWNGSNWSALGGGATGDVLALAEFNDGSGRALYAAGLFTLAGVVLANNITKWDGTNWSALGNGTSGNAQPSVRALAVFNGSGGRALYAGGDFSQAGGLAALGIAKWSNSSWSALGNGISSSVCALAECNDGHGPALFAGGRFTNVGGVVANHIAKWNGSSWSTLGTGMSGTSYTNVNALTEFDDGSGPALYAGGGFTAAGGVAANNIAKWNGSSWSALGDGVTGTANPWISALAVFDEGSGAALYAGGYFTMAGGVTVNHIAKWNGSTWSALGTGVGGSGQEVSALAVFDDGTGRALYAAGKFSTAGGVGAANIAKWNGSSWVGLGNSISASSFPFVSALTVFDDGTGDALYLGGLFNDVSGVTVNHLAKWNGSTWSALGGGVDNSAGGPAAVYALATFDEGNGPRLFAKGDFTTAGGVAAVGVARWDGTAWSPLGQGLSTYYSMFVGALAVFDDSSGPALYVGGWFTSALDSHDSHLAKWGCPFVDTGSTFCTPGTTSNGCVPTISASGNASATSGSGFTIAINNLESHRLGVIFYGIHGQLASPWGAGGASLLCVKAPTQRMDTYNSGGSPGLCNGLISEDWNLFTANHASALGQPFLGGETVWAQGWYRDPPAPKTTGLSNGLVFAVGP